MASVLLSAELWHPKATTLGKGPLPGVEPLAKLCRRWIFRLNLPLSVIMVGCVVFFMPLKKVEGDWKM